MQIEVITLHYMPGTARGFDYSSHMCEDECRLAGCGFAAGAGGGGESYLPAYHPPCLSV
jgi:hypothetical protein